MYIHRSIESAVIRLNKSFAAVLIIGPKEIGKLTLLRHCDPQRRVVSLADLKHRALAQRDPTGFMRAFPPPVTIAEIQYAPELLSEIKARAEESGGRGLFWITCSQEFAHIPGNFSSLAGLAGVLPMTGLTLSESMEIEEPQPFLPTAVWAARRSEQLPFASPPDLEAVIRRGCYPAAGIGECDNDEFYADLEREIVEHDVRELLRISDCVEFYEFMILLASAVGRPLNCSEIARDMKRPVPTVKRWISILYTLGLVFPITSFMGISDQRMIKSPKFYFRDTGLAFHLARSRLSEEQCRAAMFENYVVSAIIASYGNRGRRPGISYYRDKEGRQIDIILEENGMAYPVAVRSASDPDVNDVKSFAMLERIERSMPKKPGEGAVICNARTHMPLTDRVSVIPAWYL